MGRHTNAFQRTQDVLNAICELDGCCGQRQHRGAHNEQYQTHTHFHSHVNAFPCQMQEAKFPNHLFSLGQKEVDDRRKENDDDNAF